MVYTWYRSGIRKERSSALDAILSFKMVVIITVDNKELFIPSMVELVEMSQKHKKRSKQKRITIAAALFSVFAIFFTVVMDMFSKRLL